MLYWKCYFVVKGTTMKQKIIIAIGGASGVIYAKLLLDKLKLISERTPLQVGVVMSSNAHINWQLEIGDDSYQSYPFQYYDANDFMAPFASGSARYKTMIICPASMGQISRIANGISSNLIERAADVILKERRRLIVVPREMPYSLIHIRNMEALTLAGAIICPASPSFYSNPKNVDELLSTVVDRLLDLAGFEIDSFRWGE